MMKNRWRICILVLAVVLFSILLWQRPAKQAIVSRPLQVSFQPANALAPIVSAASQSVVGVTPSATFLPAAQKPPATFDDRSPEAIRKYIESQNIPIDFYGKIVDQNTNQVAGAKFQANVRHWISVNPVPFGAKGTMLLVEKETDADGRLEIHDITGDGFDVKFIQKTGYILSPTAPRSFGPGSGSKDNPVIIKMWNEGAKETLVGGNHLFGMDSGKTYTLDLLTGKKILGETDGDLRVTITRPSGVQRRDRFEWSFIIEGIKGGLLETDDDFMYLAPKDGYQPKLEMRVDPDEVPWKPSVKKRFFIRTRDGQVYGRVQVEVVPVYNVHSALEIDYAVNPAGSRNLQP